MAIYEYRCPQDGAFDVHRPIGTAPESVPCSVCGGESMRMVSMPMIKRMSNRGLVAALDRAQKSRYEPDVVTSLPAAGAMRPRPSLKITPALAHLPRP